MRGGTTVRAGQALSGPRYSATRICKVVPVAVAKRLAVESTVQTISVLLHSAVSAGCVLALIALALL